MIHFLSLFELPCLKQFWRIANWILICKVFVIWDNKLVMVAIDSVLRLCVEEIYFLEFF
jgi:hypothetical protein